MPELNVGAMMQAMRTLGHPEPEVVTLTKDWIDNGLRNGTSPFVRPFLAFETPSEFPNYKKILKQYGVTALPPTVSFYPSSLNQSPDVISIPEQNESKPNFVIPKGIGINYKPGIWHFPLISTEDMNFLVVDRLGEGNNLILHDLNKENITLEFKA